MVSPKLAVGDLAFIGPTHAPALAKFGYVKVHHLDGSDAIVRMAGPDLDDGDGSQEFSVPIGTLQLRIVIIAGAEVVPMKLHDPPRANKADPITYALQVGASVSNMAVNPRSYFDSKMLLLGPAGRQATTAASYPPRFTRLSWFLSYPTRFDPLVRPHDLSMVYVYR
ncbi:hypothetical protein PF008_g16558 [Phytophthora fragariae]|uniref:Uncharacterized protein n=1 Tax=Phytophthora fragariae TaxID=53985 RepID=A0A6G0RAY1_9STRA|nr:hypothetical protein PF008_g16558 [Phytophthora fragariae]